MQSQVSKKNQRAKPAPNRQTTELTIQRNRNAPSNSKCNAHTRHETAQKEHANNKPKHANTRNTNAQNTHAQHAKSKGQKARGQNAIR